MKKNLIVAQSGGPTSVINSSLLGVIEEAFKHQEISEVFGSLNGIDGILNDNIIDLRKEDQEELKKLKTTPGAILGSVRHCLPKNFTSNIYKTILEQFKKYEIAYFLYIGGNDSMDTVLKLSEYFKEISFDCKVIGVPKTIDNDLALTDHSPGYGSAIKFISSTIQEIYYDTNSYQKGRVTIVEIMGRDSGWLTAGSKLACLNNAGPDLIYLPEVEFDLNKFLDDVNKIYQQKQKVLVCVSEGIRDLEGKYVLEKYAYLNNNDVFGHFQLGGVSLVLSNLVKEKLSLPVRAIELNLLQRCSITNASKVDIEEAYLVGKKAVNYALKNHSGKMVAIKRISNHPYKIETQCVDIKKVANKATYVPQEWIVNNHDLNDNFYEYALPLIQQEPNIFYKNGLLDLAVLKRIKV